MPPTSRLKPHILLLVMFVAAISSCAKNVKPDVEMSMILPASAQRMEVPKDQAFLMAVPILEELPVYPADLIVAKAPDISACVEFVVTEDGEVGAIRPMYQIPECPMSEQQLDSRFTEAVVDAVSKWTFFAAATCYFPPGSIKSDDCSGNGVVLTRVAIKMAFVFTFQLQNGRALVKARRP